MTRYKRCENGCRRLVPASEGICEACKHQLKRLDKICAKKVPGWIPVRLKMSIDKLPWKRNENGVFKLQCKNGLEVRVMNSAPEGVLRVQAHWAIDTDDGQTHSCSCKPMDSIPAAKLAAVRAVKEALGLPARTMFHFVISRENCCGVVTE